MTERCQTDGGNIFMSSFSYLANCRCHTGKALKGNYFLFANGTKEEGIRLVMNISKIRSQCMDLDMVYIPAMPPSRSNGEGEKEFQMRKLTHVSFANAEINVCLRSFSLTATDEIFFAPMQKYARHTSRFELFLATEKSRFPTWKQRKLRRKM